MSDSAQFIDGQLKDGEEEILTQILRSLRCLRYGYVTITVQNSKVVQIDKTEKIRFEK